MWKKIKVRKKFKVRLYVEIQLDLIKNRSETQQEYENVQKNRLRQPNEHKNILFYHYVKENAARRDQGYST